MKTENGHWLPCDVPGPGVEVNEAEAARHPFAPELMPTVNVRAPDGAVLDW